MAGDAWTIIFDDDFHMRQCRLQPGPQATFTSAVASFLFMPRTLAAAHLARTT